jgi:hypothetical protein
MFAVFPAPYVAAGGGTPTETGFTLVGTGETVNTGGSAWSNPGNITTDDGTSATCNVGTAIGGATGDTLRGSNCGLAIPGGATIDGIEVRVQLLYSPSNGIPTVNSINIGKDDSTPGTAKTPGTVLTTSFVDYDYGSSSDLWGLTWTAAEINSTEFQAFFDCNNTGFGAQVNCDAMWINVHYTA